MFMVLLIKKIGESMRYNIQIKEIDGKYFFELWYCGKQEMGRSKSYNSYNSCVKGLNNFKKWIFKNYICDNNWGKIVYN